LEDVLWWITQARRGWHRCPFHIPRRKLTQICTLDTVASNKQWSRVWSTHPWTVDRNFSWNQMVTCLWRFSCGHQSSQQRLGLHQRQHGRLLCWSMKTREKFPRTRNPACSMRFKHSDRCSRQTRIEQSEGLARCVCRGVAVTLHKTTR
jgi:hypothetical protein